MHAVNRQTTLVCALPVSALFKALTSWHKMLPEMNLKRQYSQRLFAVIGHYMKKTGR